jgi:hypothetical protein
MSVNIKGFSIFNSGIKIGSGVNTWIFSTATDAESVDSSSLGTVLNLGLSFIPVLNGYVKKVRFWKTTNNTGPHTASLYTINGSLLGQIPFTGETATGWQETSFTSSIPVTANNTYIVAYSTTKNAGNFYYQQSSYYFSSSYTSSYGVLTVPPHVGGTGSNGLFSYTSAAGFPSSGSSFSAYTTWSLDVSTNWVTGSYGALKRTGAGVAAVASASNFVISQGDSFAFDIFNIQSFAWVGLSTSSITNANYTNQSYYMAWGNNLGGTPPTNSYFQILEKGVVKYEILNSNPNYVRIRYASASILYETSSQANGIQTDTYQNSRWLTIYTSSIAPTSSSYQVWARGGGSADQIVTSSFKMTGEYYPNYFVDAYFDTLY